MFLLYNPEIGGTAPPPLLPHFSRAPHDPSLLALQPEADTQHELPMQAHVGMPRDWRSTEKRRQAPGPASRQSVHFHLRPAGHPWDLLSLLLELHITRGQGNTGGRALEGALPPMGLDCQMQPGPVPAHLWASEFSTVRGEPTL